MSPVTILWPSVNSIILYAQILIGDVLLYVDYECKEWFLCKRSAACSGNCTPLSLLHRSFNSSGMSLERKNDVIKELFYCLVLLDFFGEKRPE